ncbi:Uncharacterised protein [Escherichia coli]|nr:Uncharacterised protein [Escherichia coli]CAD7364912.1 Uncharacterised protein [Escherichia coli]STM76191.1 Uncharacterised protein [Escherichia coli]
MAQRYTVSLCNYFQAQAKTAHESSDKSGKILTFAENRTGDVKLYVAEKREISRIIAGAFRLMVGGNTRRPDVERPRKTFLFNRGPNISTLSK